jgi:multiple sugar transport system substrate-binding protein
MYRKVCGLLAILVVASLVLVACAPQTVTVEVPVERAVEVEVPVEQIVEVVQERVEVRLSGWVANPQETALLESLLYRFSLEHPDIVVRYEPITGDYWQAIKTLVGAREAPDIYYMDIFQFPFFAQEGVLVPLDDLMATTGITGDLFIPDLIDAFTYEGKVYGIPKDFNTLALFYNRDMFDAAGLEYPTDEWTWDDLGAAAEALSDPDQNIYGLGVPADPGRFPIFVFQNGGQIMTADFADTLLDSAEATEAARFYTSFYFDGIGALPSDVGEGWQGTAFGKGNFAMVYEGGWLIPYLDQQFPDLNYGAVLPPQGPRGYGNLIFTVAYVISRDCQNPEAAWQVIKFITNEASQTSVLESGFALPSRVSLADHPYFQEHPTSATIFRGASGATPFMWGLYGSDVNEQMGQALERIYLEGMDPAASFQQAAQELRETIE